MARVLLGREGTLSVGGTLVDITNVTLNLEGSEVDVTRRASNGNRETEVALLDASVDFELKVTEGGGELNNLITAWQNRSAVQVSVSGYYSGPCKITKVSVSEPIDGEVTASVTVRQTTPDS